MSLRAALLPAALLSLLAAALAPVSADDAVPVPIVNVAGPADPNIYGVEISDDDRNHWAFRPIAPVTPPTPDRNAEWIRNPIDAFVLAKLQQKGLAPSPPADDRTWLRRVSFDLTGLPPTPEELDAFLKDESTDRRSRVVDRLLASPNYGIRWGRRWLDVVRYADTNGYERDGDKPHAWRYRDYVIDSLNSDKPFDRFLTEQLAGDEFDDANAETMIATTFLRLGTWDDEPADPMVDRYEQLDDIVGTVSATFLGLTLRQALPPTTNSNRCRRSTMHGCWRSSSRSSGRRSDGRNSTWPSERLPNWKSTRLLLPATRPRWPLSKSSSNCSTTSFASGISRWTRRSCRATRVDPTGSPKIGGPARRTSS